MLIELSDIPLGDSNTKLMPMADLSHEDAGLVIRIFAFGDWVGKVEFSGDGEQIKLSVWNDRGVGEPAQVIQLFPSLPPAAPLLHSVPEFVAWVEAEIARRQGIIDSLTRKLEKETSAEAIRIAHTVRSTEISLRDYATTILAQLGGGG